MGKINTELNDQLDSLINSVVLATGLEIHQIEKKLGYAKGRLGQAKSKGQVGPKLLTYIKNTFHSELGIKPETMSEEPELIYETPSAGTPMAAIFNLTQSNKTLAESNKILAISQSSLVEMVRKSEGAASRSPAADLAILSDLLEVIAEVAAGKKYRSKQEALAELNKHVLAAASVKK